MIILKQGGKKNTRLNEGFHVLDNIFRGEMWAKCTHLSSITSSLSLFMVINGSDWVILQKMAKSLSSGNCSFFPW
jgi:hypothetical protein